MKLKNNKTDFICNADSYGNIDYGKPLIFGDKGYRTSTYVGHRHIPAHFREEHYAGKARIGAHTLNTNSYLSQERFKTTHREAYTKKYMEPASTAKTASHCMDVHYITTVKEKMYRDPPMPAAEPVSEYHEVYVPKPQIELIFSPCPSAECKLQTKGLDEQPRVFQEAGGSYKLLDPYLSTTRLAHFQFTPDMIKFGSAKNVPTFYKSLVNPYTGPVPKEPIYDCKVFKNPIRNRLVPEKQCRVPHQFGISSEYQSKYYVPHTHPTIDLILLDREAVDYRFSNPAPNKTQTQCAPGMYCTEKCHLGTDWAPNRIINPKGRFEKKVKVHQIPCYSHVVG